MGVGVSRRCLDNGGCHAMVDMIEETERRRVELRQGPGRTVEGVAVRYGDLAQLPLGRRAYRGRGLRAPWRRDPECPP